MGFKASYVWRSLLEGRKILEKGLVRIVRSGRSTKIWEHDWIPTLSKLTNPPQFSSFLQDCYTVRDLMTNDGLNWNKRLIYNNFNKQEADAICRIPISRGNQPDRIGWKFSRNGHYSVKSGYWVAKKFKDGSSSKASSSSNNPEIWKWLWKIDVQPKIKIQLWRCMKGRLPTLDQLRKRQLVEDHTCIRCGNDQESIEHCLRDCEWSRNLWKMSKLELRLRLTRRWESKIGSWLKSRKSQKNLWKPSPTLSGTFGRKGTFESSNKKTFLLLNVLPQKAKILKQDPIAPDQTQGRWTAPPQNTVKINTDASISKEGRVGMGGVIRNHDHNFLPIS